MDAGLFVLRVFVGLLVAGHGVQKLFGWFGGSGIQGFGGYMASMGLRPARFWGTAGGVVETGGGTFLALGLLTPLAAAAIVGQMATAMALVHRGKGWWNSNGGHEFPALVGTAALAFAFTGPGLWSLDAALGIVVAGWPFGLGAAGLGLVAAGIVLALRRLEPRELP